ncbi:MAG: alpha/beta hydrolase [Dehalococcoidia bacterium]|nr:MAG: alpha/beta hydrolase [Dehalococcoidia bacterium]
MFKHEYADLKDIRLHYVTAGKGKLIMFAHGFPEFWYEWKNQLIEFMKDYQVVAPDMRGYNLSSKPVDVEQYRVEHLIEDLRLLAEHLGHRRFILVGHDWGGVVAWVLASRYPRSLDKLIIINAPHPKVFDRELRGNPDQQKASRYMLMFRSSEAERRLSANNYALLADIVLSKGLKEGYFTGEDRSAYLDAWAQPGAITGSLNYYRATRVGPPSDQYDQGSGNFGTDISVLTATIPTLVIWGEKDRFLLTGNLVGLDKFVPDLTVKRIPGGSHWVVNENPALVNAYIRDFIAGNTTSPAWACNQQAGIV